MASISMKYNDHFVRPRGALSDGGVCCPYKWQNTKNRPGNSAMIFRSVFYDADFPSTCLLYFESVPECYTSDILRVARGNDQAAPRMPLLPEHGPCLVGVPLRCVMLPSRLEYGCTEWHCCDHVAFVHRYDGFRPSSIIDCQDTIK